MITVDFNRLKTKPGIKILDIGSGPGRHTGAAARLENVTAIGADISFRDIAEARERLLFQARLGECRGRWGLLTTNILQLPFPRAAFDVVICAEVLEHIRDHDRAASEIIRILKPGGTLAVSVPRTFPERICWKLSRAYTSKAGGHIRIYSRTGLVALLEKHGVRFSSSHYAHSLHTPFWWLKCLLGLHRDDNPLIKIYHRFLVWDLMKQPPLTRQLERLLNPILGKSLVCYLRK